MKRTITVLQDDIDNATPRKPNKCAISRAVYRDLADLIEPAREDWDGGYEVSTVPQVVYLNSLGLRADLPEEARRFIAQFDGWDSRKPEPFKFEIELKSSYHLGNPAE